MMKICVCVNLAILVFAVGQSVKAKLREKPFTQKIRHARRLEAIGQLAGGIAHDFNNLLTVILGYSDMLLTRVPKDNSYSLVASIKNAGERAASLTRQLLAFSRKQVLELKIVSLNEIVTNIEKILRRLIGEDILLTTGLSPAISQVKVDPGQIEQVIINLAVNARDAMPQGGQLIIETSDVVFNETTRPPYSSIEPGRYTELSVTDSGCGIAPEIKERIFEPFFTTKEVGKGTGLGLATVFGIVKQSEGYLEVESEIGAGTTFKIYFPAIESKTSAKSLEDGLETATAGSETILLVEDEDAVRAIAKLALEMHGYQVLEACGGNQAISVATGYAGRIDLLITDVVMPEMSGRQLAELLHEKFPTLKVLFMSGYMDDAILRHGISTATEAFLQKPFSPVSLANKARLLLDEKTGSV
jgi:nitrogen-specific signal transduction histidine kinase